MKIDRKFNTLNLKEYIFYIDNHKKYTDFNTLGLYRSIIENEKLSPEDKFTVRDYAHKFFRKTFDFLQLKDPDTFVKLEYLGQEFNVSELSAVWQKVKDNQQKILSDKKIKHRNFGEYSKHNCGYEDCPYNGLMIRQGTLMAEATLHFSTDKDKRNIIEKSKKIKKERKSIRNIIRDEMEEE